MADESSSLLSTNRLPTLPGCLLSQPISLDKIVSYSCIFLPPVKKRPSHPIRILSSISTRKKERTENARKIPSPAAFPNVSIGAPPPCHLTGRKRGEKGTFTSPPAGQSTEERDTCWDQRGGGGEIDLILSPSFDPYLYIPAGGLFAPHRGFSPYTFAEQPAGRALYETRKQGGGIVGKGKKEKDIKYWKGRKGGLSTAKLGHCTGKGFEIGRGGGGGRLQQYLG